MSGVHYHLAKPGLQNKSKQTIRLTFFISPSAEDVHVSRETSPEPDNSGLVLLLKPDEVLTIDFKVPDAVHWVQAYWVLTDLTTLAAGAVFGVFNGRGSLGEGRKIHLWVVSQIPGYAIWEEHGDEHFQIYIEDPSG